MPNPFARHGIDHLSASSVSLYRAQPALWILRYLFGIKDEAGAAAWRGSAVEAGIDHILYKQCPDEDAIAIALESFEMKAAGDLDEKVQKERDAIPAFVKQASKLLRPLGEPVARQFQVEQWLDGIDVPLVGYVDYMYPKQLIDLKTTMRMPSEPRKDHAAQVVSYADASGRAPALAYVTPAKGTIYANLAIDVSEARRTMLTGARAIQAMLSMVGSKEHAASLFAPDFESFYWSAITIAAAAEIWN
jgi:PD-(D/E)XK nuclease superfamily